MKSASQSRRAGEFLPTLHFLQFLDALEKRVLRLITGLRLRAIQPREIVRIDVIEQAIHHPVAFVQIDSFDLEILAQDREPLRIFARENPVQIQPPALTHDPGLVGLISP